MRADCSVIITNYNKPPEQLMECVQSIKDQTAPVREIILVDDCSDDPRAHADAVSIILPKNVGVAKARDIGVKMSKGKLLLFVDADDKLAPDFIQQCGKVIAKGIDIAYPNLLLFGNVACNKLIENTPKVSPRYLLGRKTSIPVTSMMFRSMYDALGGFRDLPVFEDWDFWIRALGNGYTFARANTLLWYRQNPKSRNKANMNIKTTVHSKITAPYQVVNGRLEERRANGK